MAGNDGACRIAAFSYFKRGDQTMPAAELYTDLTNKIVASLEAGDLPAWRQPWSGGKAGFLPLRHNGVAYRGINTLILAIEGMAKGY